MSGFFFIGGLFNPKEEFVDELLLKCGPLLMFISVAIGFLRINIKNYNEV